MPIISSSVSLKSGLAAPEIFTVWSFMYLRVTELLFSPSSPEPGRDGQMIELDDSS